MSDTIWEELVRSPLDPDPNEQPLLLATFGPFLLAGIVGLLVGIFVMGDSGDTAVTTTVEATDSTTTAAPAEPNPEVPAGYVEADGVGLQPMVAYSRDGNLYVAVSESTRSDLDPGEVPAFHSSDWVLAGDGIEITAARAIESHLAPGVRVIEFPDVLALPVSVPELIVRSASEMVVRSGCQGCGAFSADEASGEITLESLDRPFLLDEPLFINVGAAITLSIDHLEFTDEWGYVEWHIIDENEARVRLNIVIVFEGTTDPDFEEVFPTQLIPDFAFNTGMQNPVMANPQSFTRQGWIVLDRIGEIISDQNSPTSLTLHWDVEWQHPVGDEIVLPLDGITDLGTLG